MVETRTDSRRQQIEDAASVLFRERGYAATSVRDIAQRLNIQGASLYAHVASKEDVLWSIVQRAAGRFRAASESIAARDSLGARDQLGALIRCHVEIVTSDLGNATVFLHEWRFLGPERREQIRSARDAYESHFRRVIEAGQRTDEFLPGDPRLTAQMILSALNGIATWYRPDGRLSAQTIADHFSALFLRALACDSAARPPKEVPPDDRPLRPRTAPAGDPALRPHLQRGEPDDG